MSTINRIAASALAVAAIAPATALAAQLDLRGAMSLRQTGDRAARVTFAVDERLTSVRDTKVVFSDQGSFAVKSAGRHGNAYRYVSDVKAARKLVEGTRYTVRVKATGAKSVVAKIKLIDKR